MTYETTKVELRQCGDCAALPGYPHSKGCDVARCPACGQQQIQCTKHWRYKTPSMWTGIWPGEIECIEYNLWSKFVYTDTGELVNYANMDFKHRRPCKHYVRYNTKGSVSAEGNKTKDYRLPKWLWKRI